MLTELKYVESRIEALEQTDACIVASDTSILVHSAAESPLGESLSPLRRGGWPPSQALTWDQVEEITLLARRLCQLGFAPTHFVTIMPLKGSNSERKRACTLVTARIGQSLKRHREAHVGLTIFEHSPSADLHAHHILHVPRREFATLERFHRVPEVDIRQIKNLDGLIKYLTKEHMPRISAKLWWQPGEVVPGKRWTPTRAARAIVKS